MKETPEDNKKPDLNRIVAFEKKANRLTVLYSVSKNRRRDIHKPFDAKKFIGILKVDEDGLVIQKRLRDEWN